MPPETQVHYNKQYLQEEIKQLANLQQATVEQKPLQPIDTVLADAKETLTEAYRVLARAAKKNRELSSAAEWIIDNFYIIQEQIVQLKEDLPESYYKKLPRLVEGEYRGYPRTYEIVQMLASVSDNIIDQDNTTTAIKAYQEIDTLNLAEMWSVPLMNRLALIIRLAERSEKLLRDRRIQDEIDNILRDKLSSETKEPGYLLRKLSEIVEQQHDTSRFLVLLAQRLQMRGMLTETERRWFDYKFSKWDTNLEEQLRNRAQQTSRLQLSIQNAISSLRDISETDWSDFVETCSVVERILRFDPADQYAQMDFNTRDTYRKRVEKLSDHSGYSEQEVAEQALMMAESAAKNGTVRSGKKMHIGFYLLDDGFRELAEKIGYDKPLDEWIAEKVEQHPSIYFSAIFIHLVVLMWLVELVTGFLSHESWFIVITLVASFLPALDLSIVSTNRIATLFFPPRIMPKMEFENDIPGQHRTVVVVPTLFSSPEDVEEQFEQLEIRALANNSESLQFALLSDFHDAPSENMESDEPILETAKNQLNELNQRHHSKYGDKFLLFHRERLWNQAEQTWMGWERKRGKIEEFNKLLVDPSVETTFMDPNQQFLGSVKIHPVAFVITLDSDTKLPPGSAKKLIGAAAHPLNRAEIDESGRYVESGYGIFQPRISIPPKSANETLFANIFSGNVGLDPYTTAVSDVYQDLFGEGVYTGKGIYDVEVFDKVIGQRLPENTILSHDLLESTYLRSALLTDVELFDDYPSTYLSFTKRNHRWIRGDWQILFWLFRKVPGPEGEKERNPINIISRWKIFDNLRRSLNQTAMLLFLLFGWVLLPGSALMWTIAAFGVVAFPIYSSFSTDVFRRPQRVGWRLYFEKLRADLKMNTMQSLTSFLFLPHQAYVSLDAIFRTLYRLFVSRKKLLEWTAASQVESQLNDSLLSYWKIMLPNLFWAAVCIALVAIFDKPVLIITIPISLAWAFTPQLAYYLERAPNGKGKDLKPSDFVEMKRYARRTWHYFEQYMNEDHSWLPPDNVQEDPYIGPVGRTSPTNIGLSLVSTITAHKMGYITFSTMIDRFEKTIDSMQMLDQYRGHFYNWYSTKLGAVLSPSYVSTVDSGNLAASLLVVQQYLQQVGQNQWPDSSFWDGLKETLIVIEELLQELEESRGHQELYELITEKLDFIKRNLPTNPPKEITQWQDLLSKLKQKAKELKEVNLSVLQEEFEDVKFSEWKDWFSRPFLQIESQLKEIREYLSADGKTVVSDEDKKGEEIIRIHAVGSLENKLRTATRLAKTCSDLVGNMDFKLVYNSDRELFSIGFNVDHAMQDKGTYDLLASEARLASFIAIAKGDVLPKHWFKLSRRLTSIEKNEILLSWGGTIFEYLMPLLFMSRYDKTLLSNTYEQVVNWQEDYGDLRHKPWGFSESAYNVLSLELHYQYRAFGAPGLGLRRGLAEDYVVAPYASMLAMMVHPVDALKNLRKLKEEGAYGTNGFYEAIDYTSSRLNNQGKQDMAIIRMYMAHHQGMSLLALSNVLYDNFIQYLFHSHPMVQSCELLLQERIPRGIPIKEPRPIDVELEPAEEEKIELSIEHAGIDDLNEAPPRTHILSNGRYSTVLTHTGTGYSYHQNVMLTRWRPDIIQDPYGKFFYVRDLETGEYWSVGHQPVKRKADRYDSWYHAGKVQYARVDEWIESFMEVCVSPEDDIELRKITLTNYSDRKRKIELTSYAEVVLNNYESDRSHTAFSNLFVQTEYIKEHHALLAKRRPRGKDEEPMWLIHTIASEDIEDTQNAIQIETERGNFIGRNRNLANPLAMDMDAELSGAVGNVRDPIVSIRRTITLNPGQKKNVTFGLGWQKNREDAIAMADRYDNPYATDRVFELASIYGNIELEHLGLSGDQAHYFQKLSGHLLYNSEAFRADEAILNRNRKKQSDLWVHGISGDVPILVYHIDDQKFIKEVTQLLKAHALWRHKGLKMDLVFMNDHPPSYVDELQEAIMQQVQISSERHRYQDKGRAFLFRSDQLSAEDRVLIDSVAKVVLKGELPKLEQITTQDVEVWQQKQLYQAVSLSESPKREEDQNDDLMFFNGFGGFTHDGREYVIRLSSDSENEKLTHTPAPWVNVITNSDFGFITSESGSDFTWSQNSRENKLTPWSNDAVMDPPGEVLYLRDEEQKLFWSPTPNPTPGSHFHEVRHGFGYSTWRSETLNIKQDVTKWVDRDDPVKIVKLHLQNTDLMSKKLTIYRFVDWVLGIFRENATRYLVTSFDESTQSIFARNYFNNEFAGRTAFAGFYTDKNFESDSYTADRSEFIGRNRNLHSPRVLGFGQELNYRFGTGFESCAASQITLELDSGESADLYFYMGETASTEDAKKLVTKYRESNAIESSLEGVKTFWNNKLQRIKVNTPAPEMDVMSNGWLQYQNIASRMWARSGFYQVGGAYGFRDQLQDSAAACYIDPKLSRNQILLHASHQFSEGDVLHWWHPPTGRGIRSRISDDLLWLPYVTAFYLDQTGDESILDEERPFLNARQLQDDEGEAYLRPEISNESATLYEHCCRAIDHSLTTGEHGLPLMGTGDWNDGMNNIGSEGKGESVWLGFFIYEILNQFKPICKNKNDAKRTDEYQTYQKNLKKHLNKEGWDGEWYRRAFYDDGTPLGSKENEECRIDAIAQAWSVISGVATPKKAKKALESADRLLVSESEGLIRLLTPAFDRTEKNPGYIKGYIPGVRENGGQYTHAALWLVWAFAKIGDREKANRLLQMLLPINHARNKSDSMHYLVEPYVVAADIYGEDPLTGVGGWTWYTGSAGWMYRVILEAILGIEITDNNVLKITPFITPAWKRYNVVVHGLEGETEYHLEVLNPKKLSEGTITAYLDDQEIAVNKKKKLQCKMKKDNEIHHIKIEVS